MSFASTDRSLRFIRYYLGSDLFILILLVQFKRDAHKMVNITDFTVVLLEDPRHPDTFQLTDDTRGKTGSLKALMLFY